MGFLAEGVWSLFLLRCQMSQRHEKGLDAKLSCSCLAVMAISPIYFVIQKSKSWKRRGGQGHLHIAPLWMHIKVWKLKKNQNKTFLMKSAKRELPRQRWDPGYSPCLQPSMVWVCHVPILNEENLCGIIVICHHQRQCPLSLSLSQFGPIDIWVGHGSSDRKSKLAITQM